MQDWDIAFKRPKNSGNLKTNNLLEASRAGFLDE